MAGVVEAKGSAVRLVKITAVGTAAAVILALQLTVLSAFLDMATSMILFFVGFFAGRSSK